MEYLLKKIRRKLMVYLEKGYIWKLSKSQENKIAAFYLPWFPVVDRSRDSTPVLLVFDAAAKDKAGKSLNSEIELTPDCLQDLFKIELRLCKYQWVVTSDCCYNHLLPLFELTNIYDFII
jgi:hypothetical protein